MCVCEGGWWGASVCVTVCFSCAGDRDMFFEAEDHRQWLEQATCHVQVWMCGCVGVRVCRDIWV